jgi:hypothetical protein
LLIDFLADGRDLPLTAQRFVNVAVTRLTVAEEQTGRNSVKHLSANGLMRGAGNVEWVKSGWVKVEASADMIPSILTNRTPAYARCSQKPCKTSMTAPPAAGLHYAGDGCLIMPRATSPPRHACSA